jgi:hypothetical protein
LIVNASGTSSIILLTPNSAFDLIRRFQHAIGLSEEEVEHVRL